MNTLLTHMHVTVEAIREALASTDTATLESWRPADGATPTSAETFLTVLVVDEMARRIGGGKPRLTLVVDNENGGRSDAEQSAC